jgi:nicotinate-nucleotide adenylyltransferase
MTQKIGILGGSFNPAHAGHLNLAQNVLKKFGLNQVWLEVSPQNPLKNSTNNFEERYNSVKILCKNIPQIKASKQELQLMTAAKKFYTVSFLKRLQKKYKNTEFFWLMGADNLANFHKWHKWEELCKLVNIIVYPRPGYSQKARQSKAYKKHKKAFTLLHGKEFGVSSSEIRIKNV